MQDKQKVTLYLPPEVHRKLKITAVVNSEPMSALAERALLFYLENSDVVEAIEQSNQGGVHQVYTCPECSTSLVLRDHHLVSLANQPSILMEEEMPISQVQDQPSSPSRKLPDNYPTEPDQQAGEALVPC